MAVLHLKSGNTDEAPRYVDEGRALAQRLTAYQPNHPGYIQLLAQFDALSASLRQSAPDDPSRIRDEP